MFSIEECTNCYGKEYLLIDDDISQTSSIKVQCTGCKKKYNLKIKDGIEISDSVQGVLKQRKSLWKPKNKFAPTKYYRVTHSDDEMVLRLATSFEEQLKSPMIISVSHSKSNKNKSKVIAKTKSKPK